MAQLLLPDGKSRYLYGKTRATVYARLSEAQQRLKVGQALPNVSEMDMSAIARSIEIHMPHAPQAVKMWILASMLTEAAKYDHVPANALPAATPLPATTVLLATTVVEPTKLA